VTTIVLDAAGLDELSLPANRARLRSLATAFGPETPILIPAVVLAEAISGQAADARRLHLVRRSEVVVIDEMRGRRAGVLRGSVSGRRAPSATDACVIAVAEEAAGRDDDVLVLTSDPDDLKRLAASTRHAEHIVLHHV
jgi:predicted nucleic acid-binding protein